MNTFCIRQYGAAGDGQRKDRASIQKAVDACAQAGGGTVVCPPGRYLAGTIFLENNIELHLEAGATILGSPDRADYDTSRNTQWDNGRERYRVSGAHLVYARDAHHIAITGRGTIDGNGRAFFGAPDPDHGYLTIPGWRPGQMVAFFECRDVLIRDVQLLDSPFFSVWPHSCDRVRVQGVRLINPRNTPNGDGINPDCCRDVIISDCHIETGDDCIAVKSDIGRRGRQSRACENITVTNCRLSSPTCGVRLGFEGDGPIRNCTFSNLVMTDTRTGINMLVPRRVDEADIGSAIEHGPCIENISFCNIVMDTQVPFYLWIGDDASPPGAIRNISICDVTATARRGCYIGGSRRIPIESVRISNTKLTVHGEMDDLMVNSVPYPYATFDYWDRQGLPHGIYSRYARDLLLHDITVEWGEITGPWQSAVRMEQVTDVDLDGLVACRAPGSAHDAAVYLTDVQNAFLRNCRVPEGRLLRTDGDASERISVLDEL